MTEREKLHNLVERLPDDELTLAVRILQALEEERQDPVSAALDNAPEDDEPYRAEASVDDEPLVPHERAKLEFFR